MTIVTDKNSKKYNPYGRCRSIVGELINTWSASRGSGWKMSFFDFFVYRWYKNYIEPRLNHPKGK